jgi:signal transduction histidine kinase
MNKLADKLILLVICAVFYLQNTGGEYIAIPVVLAIAMSALLTFIENAAVPLIFALWCGLGFYNGVFLYFLPLLCYDLFLSRWQWALLFSALPLAVGIASPQHTTGTLFTLLFAALSFLLKRKNSSLIKAQSETLKLRDTAKEFAMLTESKNKELMEKQDYEVRLATLNERNRIARDIHDSVGHTLSNAILQTGAMIATCADPATKERLGVLNDTLKTGMDSIRESIHGLHKESVDLQSETEQLVRGFAFCPVRLTCDVEGNPDKKIKYALIAVLKEALSNIIRHSDATEVKITLREHPAMYQLVIKDNGGKYAPTGEGIGLKNIRQRVEGLRGVVNITQEHGFCVFVSIPKEKQA